MSLSRGRFHKEADRRVNEFTGSLAFDRRLYLYDIAGSVAHARMLARQKIISSEDARAIVRGLNKVKKELDRGKFRFKPEQEDIHMAVEARLTELVGEAGRKLHTARSRNDQAALDMRLFVKDAIREILEKLKTFQKTLLECASQNQAVIMPGYTHLQLAQPVLFAHHLLAYFEMLERDKARFKDTFQRTDVMPLGSGALAGVSYPIDRKFVAKALGFKEISQNSLDAVSDRDFVIEFESAASILMLHLSRLAEEIVIWSSAEFDFIELDEAYATGSSIMPQKKNPDVAELARGKTGRIYGHLMAMLTVMKGLPLAYNRDLQEDKEGLFDTVDSLSLILEVFTGLLKTMKVKAEKMRAAAEKGYMLATDLADYLTKKGESFRNAHATIGRLVSYAVSKNKSFGELTLAEYREFSPLFEKDVFDISLTSSIEARNIPGGTAPEQVELALKRAIRQLKRDKNV
ncbi:MAG: argininosuccinate lyase [Chloroflexota bacterium]